MLVSSMVAVSMERWCLVVLSLHSCLWIVLPLRSEILYSACFGGVQMNAMLDLWELNLWSPSALNYAQLDDVGPILCLKETSNIQPSWESVVPFRTIRISYWAQWEILEPCDEVYRCWQSPSGMAVTTEIPSKRSSKTDAQQPNWWPFWVGQDIDKWCFIGSILVNIKNWCW